MDPVLRVAATAGAITAVVVAARTMWGLFVNAVRAAVAEEMQRFHRELNSYDEFWTERIDKLEAAVDSLKEQVDCLSKKIP